jgi:hypothetical protein
MRMCGGDRVRSPTGAVLQGAGTGAAPPGEPRSQEVGPQALAQQAQGGTCGFPAAACICAWQVNDGELGCLQAHQPPLQLGKESSVALLGPDL